MYIFHKLEIIRAVNKAIDESAPLAKVGIVEAVNALSFAEVRNAAAIARYSSMDIGSRVKDLLLIVLTGESF